MKNLSTFQILVLSFAIALGALFIAYTIWFIYEQLYLLPDLYHYNDLGKGSSSCKLEYYCRTFLDVKCCDFAEVLINYFGYLIIMVALFPVISFIPGGKILATVLGCSFIISFIILYALRRCNRGR